VLGKWLAISFIVIFGSSRILLATVTALSKEPLVHSLVRRFIKTAIGFLILGLLLGGWMIVRRELFGRAPSAYEISAHTHLLLVGFVMTMILGVALWLFPRPDRSDNRYRPALAAAAYWLLTAGTVVRAASELAHDSAGGAWATRVQWLIVTSSFAQIAALVIFFYTMWSRVRGIGSREREARGERF
jgi:heme/copper-type cytochrome/quinol oxidase subunit 1